MRNNAFFIFVEQLQKHAFSLFAIPIGGHDTSQKYRGTGIRYFAKIVLRYRYGTKKVPRYRYSVLLNNTN